jgi:hypothetical protein
MAYNSIKLGAATLLALACIVALILDPDQNYVWAAPVLGILVGYVVGNSQVTSQTGTTAPIVSRDG